MFVMPGMTVECEATSGIGPRGLRRV